MAFFNSTFTTSPMGQYYQEPLRKGCSPPLHKTPDYIRQQHRIFLNNPHPFMNANFFYTTAHEISASTTPLKRLKRISLQELHMEEATKGGYLVLRTIEPAHKMVAITTIVEDHEGNAVLFAIYNSSSDFQPSSMDVFPVGTVFILKEPYIKMSISKDCMLRCDCPTDVIILHEGHELYKLADGIAWKNTPNPEPMNLVSRHPKPETAMDWKDRGNALFKEAKYEYATQCYLLALQKSEKEYNDENLLLIRLNLSASYLQSGFFEAALLYARAVLGFEPGNPKALLRAARSCYQLRKYKTALQYFQLFHKLYPDYEDGAKELNDCKSRVNEQETGDFNVYNMYLDRVYKPGEKIVCADYVGPVKVVDITGKGRGVVVTRDLEPGTLVAVSKALAFSWDDGSEFRVQINTDDTMQFGNDIKLVAQVAQSIAKNPNTFGPIVYDLFDGQPMSHSGAIQLFCDSEANAEPIADVRRIRKILDNNCFMSPFDNDEITQRHAQKLENLSKGSGLFIFPSYFNHSCVPNASWIMFNDILFVRTCKHVKAGEELLISYFPWDCDFKIREVLCGNRSFQCLCNLCNFERAEPEHFKVKRQKHIWTFRTNFERKIITGNVNAALIRNVKKLMKTFDMTYEKSSEPFLKVQMLYFNSFLAMAYRCQSNYGQEIQCYKDAIQEFGFNINQLIASLENDEPMKLSRNTIVCQRALYLFEKVIVIYHGLGDTANSLKWTKLLFALEKLYSGGDLNVVKLKYSHIKPLI